MENFLSLCGNANCVLQLQESNAADVNGQISCRNLSWRLMSNAEKKFYSFVSRVLARSRPVFSRIHRDAVVVSL